MFIEFSITIKKGGRVRLQSRKTALPNFKPNRRHSRSVFRPTRVKRSRAGHPGVSFGRPEASKRHVWLLQLPTVFRTRFLKPWHLGLGRTLFMLSECTEKFRNSMKNTISKKKGHSKISGVPRTPGKS